jgi:hypothetical protein
MKAARSKDLLERLVSGLRGQGADDRLTSFVGKGG